MNLNPWRRIRDLEDANEKLVKALANPYITGIELGRGSLEIGLQGSGASLLAGMLVGLMEEPERGGPRADNYLIAEFSTPVGPIKVTVQRVGGKTPEESPPKVKKGYWP
jgi:hypothetical protein